jgi:hypothetical protein
MKLPGKDKVSRAIKSADRAVATAIKLINRHAANAMGKGKYEEAMEVARHGQAAQAFRVELGELARRWKELGGGSNQAGNARRAVPRWEFYRPALRALLDLGGSGRREDIEPKVEELMRERMGEAELADDAHGNPKWKSVLRRARRDLAKEGWIEPGAGKLWKLTAAGQRAAQSERTGDQH